MNQRLEFLSPVGRFVWGSFTVPKTKDMAGNLIVYKSGPQAGQPRPDYRFAIAIPKKGEQHWSQTEWGAKIYNFAQVAFPGGESTFPTFAWKIVDGDSTQLKHPKGKKPCDRIGYPGNWVLTFSNATPPQLVNTQGQQILEQNFVNLGDYVRVFGNVNKNKTDTNPGLYLNHKFVAFMGYGERIILGPSAEDIEWGDELPPGASQTPVANFNPASVGAVVTPFQAPGYQHVPSTTTSLAAAAPASVAPSVHPPVQPYTQILNPPVMPTPPQAPKPRVMTPLAGAYTYEQYIAAGWDDTKLIQQGYMLP